MCWFLSAQTSCHCLLMFGLYGMILMFRGLQWCRTLTFVLVFSRTFCLPLCADMSRQVNFNWYYCDQTKQKVLFHCSKDMDGNYQTVSWSSLFTRNNILTGKLTIPDFLLSANYSLISFTNSLKHSWLWLEGPRQMPRHVWRLESSMVTHCAVRHQ